MANVATRMLAEGRRAGLASALGIGAGAMVHTALAALGLSSLFFPALAVLTDRARGAVRTSQLAARLLRRVAAVVFIGFAVRLALAQRSN